MKAAIGLVLAAVMIPLLVVVMIMGAGGKDGALAACSPAGNVTVSAPDGMVAGYGGVQLGNAVTIVKTGQQMGVPAEGLLVGVMTAMGESGLKNLNYGDDIHGVTNPDGSLTCSLGLFQQQWCLPGNPWGTKADVTDPAKAAATFFKALMKSQGWQGLAPDEAAHRVQGNYSAAGYTKFIPAARDVLAAITGGKIQSGTGGCASAGLPGSSGAGDDYPWKDGPFNENNPVTNLAYRNCTDFAWWRVVQQLGLQPLSSSKLGPGNAATWGSAWARAGWTVSKTPKVGAIVWYGAGVNGASSAYGHVAVVKEITADGRVIEEGYNFGIPPNGAYYTLTINPDRPSGYLYIPSKEEFQKAAM
ncbi:surface antigen [Arthrobacter sp. GAS37]|uniref:CHAP domain-containing protein n=1 Tax=Arthrobacter sp. GAS37 TaxID=3156261 RepID=UPI0038366B52